MAEDYLDRSRLGNETWVSSGLFTTISMVCVRHLIYTNAMDSNGRLALLLPLIAAAGLVCMTTSAAIAADVSPWDDDLQSSARLIAGQAKNVSGALTFRAGIEIKLKPGWKTYWRYPGDSGVPPMLDFSASQNVRSPAVLFPAPSRFADGAGGNSIGYKGDIVLPLHVVAQDAAKPVTLRVHLDYAVCEKLCIPAKADLELLLTKDSGGQDSAIMNAEARIPRPTKLGDHGVLAVRAVQREAGSGKPRILVDVAAPPGDAVTLFAEGPTAQWALPLPEPIAGAPAGLQRFVFDLDGLPPGEKPDGATLRLTAVSGDQAVETAFRLD